MKQAAVLLLLIGLCGILSAEDSSKGTGSSGDSARTLIERQHGSLSLKTFKETLHETGETFKRDCRNTERLLRMLTDLEKGRIALLVIAMLFCSILAGAGLKKIKHFGNGHEQRDRQ